MSWYFTPYIIPLLIATLITFGLTLYAWECREASGAIAFALLMFVLTEWSLGYALELASAELASKIFWAKVQYFGITTLPVAWLVFALQYTNHKKWLTSYNLLWLLSLPLITILLVWTNEAHNLIWTQTNLDFSGPFVALKVNYGSWFWINLLYSYILLLLGTFFLVRMLTQSAKLYQGQAGLMLVGAAMPWIGNGIYVSGLNPIPNLDLTPFAFTFSGMAIVWAFSRFRILDIVPIARQAIVEDMSDGVMVFDRQNRLVDINPAAKELIDYEGDHPIGQIASTLLPEWLGLKKALEHGTEKQEELVLKRHGMTFTFDCYLSPLYDGVSHQHQQLTGHLIVLRDITKRKRSEQILQQALEEAVTANRLKNELLAKVSHELRTPLGIILGFSELLEAGIYGEISADQQNLTQKIIENTHYLTVLVEELLQEAQLKAGKLKLNLKTFALREMVNEVENKMRLQAETKGLTLTSHIAPEVPAFLTADSVCLQQILINLIENAIKFTKQGQISLRVYCPNLAEKSRNCQKSWAIAVSDTGVGIPADAHQIIFEPFRQVDGSVTREHGGTGLGLSIVKQLTMLMEGEILLQSEVGKGSTFTVILPLEGKTYEAIGLNHRR